MSLISPIASVSAQNSGNVILVSETGKQPTGNSQLTDRITLVDGSILVGKISEMSATRVVMKVSGTDFVVEPARITKVERNISVDSLLTKQRPVQITTKDGSKIRGNLKRSDASTTFLQNDAGEIPVRNETIVAMDYLDADQVRQQDAVAARPPKWEITLKGGSMLAQIGTFNGLLSPGYFGLVQVEYPHISLPLGIRVAPGLGAGYGRNSGKSLSSTSIDFFPGHLTVTASYQIGTLPLDVYAGGLVGVSLTRVITAATAEKLSLDFSYGADIGVKYFLNPMINFRLGGIWLSISESTATLNHIGAYAAAGLMF